MNRSVIRKGEIVRDIPVQYKIRVGKPKKKKKKSLLEHLQTPVTRSEYVFAYHRTYIYIYIYEHSNERKYHTTV